MRCYFATAELKKDHGKSFFVYDSTSTFLKPQLSVYEGEIKTVTDKNPPLKPGHPQLSNVANISA